MADFWSRLFFIFIFYSVGGWIVETIRVSLKEHKFVNRGFLFGPYCPIYGFGAVVLYLSLDSFTNRPFTYFLLSMIVAALLEYITSFIQEKKYHARWWDYSNRAFNVNGRICLENLLLFGIFGTFIMCFLNKIFIEKFYLLPPKVRYISMLVLFIIVIADNILSKFLIKQIKNDIDSINGDSTYEISKKIEELIKERGFFRRRLFKAYPNLKELLHNRHKNTERRIKELEEEVRLLEEALSESNKSNEKEN